MNKLAQAFVALGYAIKWWHADGHTSGFIGHPHGSFLHADCNRCDRVREACREYGKPHVSDNPDYKSYELK